MALSKFTNIVVPITASLLLLSACDNAVIENKAVTYQITGDKQSLLYPLSVKRDSEDVLIELKELAQLPEIVSVDALGKEVAFNYTTEQRTLVVPNKFEHIQLRHAGTAPVDIISKQH